MRKSIKALFALFVFGVAAIAYMNWAALEAAYLTLATMPVLYWGVILAIPALLIIYKIGHGSELFAKLKFWKWLAEPKDGGLIPQEKRFEMAQEYARKMWHTADFIHGPLTLVDNMITPYQDKSVIYEIFYLTTDKAYADRRIGRSEIKPDKRFFVAINCKNGEAETVRFEEMDKGYEYVLGKFLHSLPRTEAEMNPQLKAIQSAMWTGLGLKMGEKAGDSAEIQPQYDGKREERGL